jgi:hypothetical protein
MLLLLLLLLLYYWIISKFLVGQHKTRPICLSSGRFRGHIQILFSLGVGWLAGWLAGY